MSQNHQPGMPRSRRGYFRGGSFRGNRPQRVPTIVPSPAPPVGPLVEAISSDDSNLINERAGKVGRFGITCAELVASYNWLDSQSPAIVVPGKPPLWTPPVVPCQLQEDSGVYYRDRNAACYPEHPLEPAIVSVMKMQHTPYHIDVVACGSTLGNLLRFVRGDEKPFRMLVEVISETIHLIRRENSPKEKIPDVRGYGHTFPEAYTTWEADVRRSLSHQRILKYKFGGLNMMVRFEGDGYIQSNKPSKRMTKVGFDGVAQLEGLSVEQASGAGKSDNFNNSLQVRNAGSETRQDAIFDLKTRSIKRRDEDILGEQLPRLWVSQISKFILAYHDRGVFNEVEIKTVNEEVQDWESQNQSSLGRFCCLLNHIKDTAHSHQDDELEIVRQAGGVLEIRKRASGARNMLSEAVRQAWAAWLEDGAKGPGRDGQETFFDAGSLDDSEEEEEDFTACDAECGYCGRCSR